MGGTGAVCLKKELYTLHVKGFIEGRDVCCTIRNNKVARRVANDMHR